MVKKKRQNAKANPAALELLLQDFAGRLNALGAAREGSILVQAVDGGGRVEYILECSQKKVRVVNRTTVKNFPDLEIIGTARQIAGVLAGKTDARKRFLAGGFRLRGDLRYASDLAMQLGILKDPL